AELIAAPVDLIFTPNIPAATAAKQASETIPIVMPVGDPVGAGLAESLNHPGGNVTGLTNISTELSGKRLEQLNATVPELSHVAMLWMEDNLIEARDLQETQAAARLLGVALQPVALRAPVDLDGVFKAILGERAEAVLVRGPGSKANRYNSRSW